MEKKREGRIGRRDIGDHTCFKEYLNLEITLSPRLIGTLSPKSAIECLFTIGEMLLVESTLESGDLPTAAG